MAKKTRRQRKLAKQRELRKRRVGKSNCEIAQIAQQEENTIGLERADTPASVVNLCMGVPESPASDEKDRKQNENEEEANLLNHLHLLSDELGQDDTFDKAIAHELDDERALDFAIARLYRRRLIGRAEIDHLAYEVSLRDFVRRGSTWSPEAKAGIRRLERYVLWNCKGHVTRLGEEVWYLFRRRIRRDSALRKILWGQIPSLHQAA